MGNNGGMNSGNNTLRDGEGKKIQSPNKNSSSILKRELLEKAKKALAEKS
jgi:hypothetical protein